MKKIILLFTFTLLICCWSIFSQTIDPCLAPIHIPVRARSLTPTAVSKLKDKALIAEYPTVFDVHNKPDTIKYPNIKIQPVIFDVPRVLEDIKPLVNSDKIDFILFFFLQEVPGWINSGGRYKNFAQNIGINNTPLNNSPTAWPRLKANPHMNDVEFLSRTTSTLPNYGSTLTAFHEIGHFTSVFFCQASPGPNGWNKSMPLAHLGAASSHWSWNYLKENNVSWPGIMYSGATSAIFNAFDLYAMGLMHYDEASKYSYTIYEDPDLSKTHKLKLDDLIFSLMQAGGSVYNAPGKRIPATDASMANLNVLTVIVKGQNEVMSTRDSNLIIKLVDDMPRDWNLATWGRSKMATNLAFNNAVQISTAIAETLDHSIKINWSLSNNKLLVSLPEKYEKQKLNLVVYDINGRLLFNSNLQSTLNEMSIPELNGVAVVTVFKGNTILNSKKVLIIK